MNSRLSGNMARNRRVSAIGVLLGLIALVAVRDPRRRKDPPAAPVQTF